MKGEKCFLEEEEEKDKIKWKSDHLLKQSWWFNIKMKTNGKGGGGGGGLGVGGYYWVIFIFHFTHIILFKFFFSL